MDSDDRPADTVDVAAVFSVFISVKDFSQYLFVIEVPSIETLKEASKINMNKEESISESEVSAGLDAKTRKNAARIEGEILRQLAAFTQARAAACMGVHASTVSRMTERIGEVSLLLAAINLQVAATDSVVVKHEDQIALKRMAYNWLKAELEAE